jgi:DNA-binding ferritin-like protein
MATTVKTKKTGTVVSLNKQIGTFVGELFSFNSSLKLYHWHVTGPSSYAQHMALDQALESLLDTIDRVAETTYALIGDIDVEIPKTPTPKNIVKHVSDFYTYVDKNRDLFPENFSQAILDDYQEALQQLLYRLVRLK